MGFLERIRPVLNRPEFYELFHRILGADRRSKILINEYMKPKEGDRILDVGCGPGNFIPYLPECRYLGVDANSAYIDTARGRYGTHGKRFICDTVSYQSVRDLGEFDLVLAIGLLHHLEDAEARDLFRMGHNALRSGGRMITVDGCYVPGQSPVARYLLSKDRGQFVRTEEAYLNLASRCFEEIRPSLRDDLLRIPHTTLILECVR
jgi:SAM-dependent methyltransferase